MKKGFKTAGIVLLSLVGLLLVLFLLARFAFRDRIVAALDEMQHTERVELLRAAEPYAADTVQYRFTYRQDTARAREIRDYFRLDTLLNPAATVWDNSLALARFVARNIPHANQKIQPQKRNAIGLWEYSRTVEPAFNCRMHAIMLHELLHASGIVSRFVTCLPADSLDADCHVVNIVWLPGRRKWAMIDSDMRAWITDPEGTPLSLQEMREKAVAGEPMEVNPLDDGEIYDDLLSYWAKNLYWFECWEDTGFDKEPAPKGEGLSVALLPPGFDGFELRTPTVATSDDARFWAAPNTDTTL